jgi:iron complex transport system substrate-binding protein
VKRWLVGLACWLALAAQALQITDDRGVAVDLPVPPRRIVSLLPSLTETVCALGACLRLVGVDRYSNHPPQVKALAQLGGGIDPSIEAIVALRPDLVLMAVSGRGSQRLESLGIKVLALEPKDMADMRRVVEQIASMLDMPDGQRLWRSIDAGVEAAAHSLPAAARNAKVYFEASRGPYAAGPRSFIGEMLARLGVRNIIAAELGPFPLISPEHVVRADPDVIMITEANAQDLAQRPGWAAMRAMREGRVCIFTPEQGDVLVRPGPRMAEAARLMADCIARTARPASAGRAP